MILIFIIKSMQAKIQPKIAYVYLGKLYVPEKPMRGWYVGSVQGKTFFDSQQLATLLGVG